MDLSLTTEIEAINAMLEAIGEAPVNTLEDAGLADANLARNILNFATREVQQIGWDWNTDYNYPLTPTSDGFLPLPGNTLKVELDKRYSSLDLIQRGPRMYDRTNHTFVVGQGAPVTITWLLPFEELPEAARTYITVRSIRQFQGRVLGSDAATRFTEKDEWSAMLALKHAEAETGNFNIFSGDPTLAGGLRRT